MNILFVAPMDMCPNVGGIQRVSNILAKAFIKLGHNVYFLCHTEDDVDDKLSPCASQFTIQINLTSPNESVIKYQSLLDELNIGCIIFQWIDKKVRLWVDNTPKNIRTIATIHNKPYSFVGCERKMMAYYKPKSLKQLILKVIARVAPCVYRSIFIDLETKNYRYLNSKVDKICLLSDKFIPRVVKYAGIAKDKLHGINNPIHQTDYNTNLKDKENIILWVGRIEQIPKNIFQFLDVWKKIYLKNPNWKAFILGEGQHREKVEKLIAGKKIKNIEVLGRRSDVFDFYAKSKIIVVTSFNEGFSMALVEGMAHGCIGCVFDSYESVYDIIDNEVNGFIVPSFSTKKMVNAIQKTIDNPIKYEAMSKSAKEKIEKFSVERIIKKWIDMINSIEK